MRPGTGLRVIAASGALLAACSGADGDPTIAEPAGIEIAGELNPETGEFTPTPTATPEVEPEVVETVGVFVTDACSDDAEKHFNAEPVSLTSTNGTEPGIFTKLVQVEPAELDTLQDGEQVGEACEIDLTEMTINGQTAQAVVTPTPVAEPTAEPTVEPTTAPEAEPEPPRPSEAGAEVLRDLLDGLEPQFVSIDATVGGIEVEFEGPIYVIDVREVSISTLSEISENKNCVDDNNQYGGFWVVDQESMDSVCVRPLSVAVADSLEGDSGDYLSGNACNRAAGEEVRDLPIGMALVHGNTPTNPDLSNQQVIESIIADSQLYLSGCFPKAVN